MSASAFLSDYSDPYGLPKHPAYAWMQGALGAPLRRYAAQQKLGPQIVALVSLLPEVRDRLSLLPEVLDELRALRASVEASRFRSARSRSAGRKRQSAGTLKQGTTVLKRPR